MIQQDLANIYPDAHPPTEAEFVAVQHFFEIFGYYQRLRELEQVSARTMREVFMANADDRLWAELFGGDRNAVNAEIAPAGRERINFIDIGRVPSSPDGIYHYNSSIDSVRNANAHDPGMNEKMRALGYIPADTLEALKEFVEQSMKETEIAIGKNEEENSEWLCGFSEALSEMMAKIEEMGGL